MTLENLIFLKFPFTEIVSEQPLMSWVMLLEPVYLITFNVMSMDFTQHEDAVPLEPYERYTPKNEEANMMCEPVMLPSGRLTSKSDENGSYLQSSIKNLLCKNLPVRPPLNKNLFSLKFETGSYFLKSI